MSDQDAVTVRGAYDAFARKDMPAVLATMDPDITWFCPEELPFGGHFDGVAEVVGYLQAMVSAFDSIEIVADRVLSAGADRVVVEGRSRVVLNAESLEVGFVDMVTMRAGKIAHVREYQDTGKLLRRLERTAVH